MTTALAVPGFTGHLEQDSDPHAQIAPSSVRPPELGFSAVRTDVSRTSRLRASEPHVEHAEDSRRSPLFTGSDGQPRHQRQGRPGNGHDLASHAHAGLERGAAEVSHAQVDAAADAHVHWRDSLEKYTPEPIGIAPGETFTYSFPIVQTGTYWFHSHTGFQEPDGAFGEDRLEAHLTPTRRRARIALG